MAKNKVKGKATWNYRVLAFESPKGDIFFQVHSVYYTNGKPDGYSETPARVGGDCKSEITKTAQLIYDACLILGSVQPKHKILWAGEKFPQEFDKKLKK
jgi:hypothetical protein